MTTVRRVGNPIGWLLLWTSTWIWLAALAVSPVIHVLFPDGRLLSRLGWGHLAGLGVDGAGHVGHRGGGLAAAGPGAARGTVLGPELDPPPALALVGLAMFGVAEAASLTAMAIPLRRAKGDEREQIKWFLYAGSFVILGITVEILLGVPITIASWLGGMVVPFAIAVALFKYRLYDIDRLILDTLESHLLAIVHQATEPTRASLWLRPSAPGPSDPTVRHGQLPKQEFAQAVPITSPASGKASATTTTATPGKSNASGATERQAAMTGSKLWTDGTALAGHLHDLFRVDLSTATACCTACGRTAPVTEARVFDHAPGVVARCPACSHVLLRLVQGRGRAWLDLRGLTYLRLSVPKEV